MTKKGYSGTPASCNNTPDVTYAYDSLASGNEGLGRRTGMSDSQSTTAWVYDLRGRVLQETKTLGTDTFTPARSTNPGAKCGTPVAHFRRSTHTQKS